MRTSLTGAALAVLLACTGCSGDGGRSGPEPTADERAAAEALSGQLLDSGVLSGRTAVARRQAGCLAEGAVATLGLDRLQHYRVLTRDLEADRRIEEVPMTRPDAVALADVFLGCVDAERLFEEQLVRSAPRLEPRGERCLRRAVDAEVARTVLRLTFQGRGDRRAEVLRDRLTRCGSGSRDDAE